MRFTLLVLLTCLFTAQLQAQSSGEKEKILDLTRRANRLMHTDIDSATFYAQEALDRSIKIKDNILKAKAYIELSQISLKDNDVPKAFEYIELAEILGNEYQNDEIMTKVTFQKGTIFVVIANNEKAIENLAAAEEYCIKTGDSSTLAVTYNSLSLIYKRTGDLDKAIKTINKSIEINKAMGNNNALAASYGNLSMFYTMKGDNESALTAISETLRLFTEGNIPNGIALSLITIGDLYLQEKEYDSCLVFLDRAQTIIEDKDLKEPLLDLWGVTAEYEVEMQNYPKALDYFTKVYNLASEFNTSQVVKEALEKMYETAKAMGDAELALEYLEDFKEISDSLERISGKEALIAMELNEKFKSQQRLHEIEKEELEIKKRNSELEAEKKNYFIFMLILIGILVIIGATTIILRKQYTIQRKEKRQQELTDELELKNKELVSSAIQILRKSEEMKNTIESLQELNQRATPDDSKLLLSIIRKLKFELEHNTWEEFEVPFKQLHSSFYNNLVEKYPELTRAEIKVCSLLKLNMDTKQIAAILHKTPASIEVDRSRIRKKMGLTNTKTSLTRHITTNI